MSTPVTRRLRIRHTTRVSYAQAAGLLPQRGPHDPPDTPRPDDPGRQGHGDPTTPTWSYWDYWGTQVTGFDLMEPHEDLTITASSLVETAPPGPCRPPRPPGQVARTTASSRLLEYTSPTGLYDGDAEVGGAGEVGVDGPGPPRDGGRGLGHGHRPGLVPPRRHRREHRRHGGLEQGAGVCQDITHLTAALLRGLGVPTRYVSGYLHPERDAELHRPVAGQSHAWIEYWAGDWTGYDPTNSTRADESHVVVGRGRDYDDVTPHKGIYRGRGRGPTGGDGGVHAGGVRLSSAWAR